MVGDRDVPVAAVERRLSHFADRVPPVARGSVHVHVPADVARLNNLRQFMLRGTLNLTQALAHLGRNPLHPQRGIDLFLGRRGHGRPSSSLASAHSLSV